MGSVALLLAEGLKPCWCARMRLLNQGGQLREGRRRETRRLNAIRGVGGRKAERMSFWVHYGSTCGKRAMPLGRRGRM